MTGGFQVDPEQLTSHASAVEAVAGSVEEAASAAATERMGGLVYGVLFDALALPFLNMWADSLHGYIDENAAVGHAIAAALRNNADTYAAVERHNAGAVSRSGGG